MIRNARPKLNVLPVMPNMVLVPAAIPLLYRGTAFIIDALFGEAKTPIPVPINAKGNRVSKKVDFIPNPVSIKKPTADMKRPIGDIILDPYLSDIQPLTGPKIDNDIDTGRRYMPASSGLSFMVAP